VVSKSTKVTSRRKRRVVKQVTATAEALRDYELVLIISPEVSEAEFEAALNYISQLISADGGVVSHIEQWGKRKLAYPIEHFTEGSYALMRLNMRPSLSKELETKLKISEEFLRYLLIRLSS
jgi:small subunit ribosomal protein S6|tara:strand:- start:840 stop:1205 length:366 start_codon:yes stop_codon:yes gene_type:complete